MAMPGGPLRATVSESDPLDDEWERFAQNGCPDWWLLTKYVGQAAARSFPYARMSAPGAASPPGNQGRPGPAHAAPPPASKQPAGLELQHVSCKQEEAAAGPPEQPAPHAAGTGKQQGASVEAAAPAAVPDALPTTPSRAAAATGTAAAAAAAGPANCGLKGIFGCTGCAPVAPADQTA